VDYLQLDDLPTLRRPTFIAAFRGWNDAGEAATLALRHVIDKWSAQSFAVIDPEEFFDFTVARPTVRVTEEGLRDVKWPSNRFFYHRRRDAESDVVVFLATEPHLKWRAFGETVRHLFERLDSSRLVTLGSFVVATTHTRPPPVSGFTTDDELLRRMQELTVGSTRYEGPTGIVGTLHDAWRRSQLPTASLWVGLPAYLGGNTNPQGALALLETLDQIFGFGLDLAPLADASRAFIEQVNQALADNSQMQAFLADLERRIDAQAGDAAPPDLPSSGEIIGELEDFLRGQRTDD
jgi:proteasome assembly chaperone (PAC2) family protein